MLTNSVKLTLWEILNEKNKLYNQELYDKLKRENADE